MHATIERTPVVPVPRNLNWPFLALLVALVAGLVVAYELEVEPRLLSTLLGSAAFGGLMWRLITTWTDTPVLVHVLTILFVLFLLNAAVGQYQLSTTSSPLTIAVWPGIVLRAALIVLVIHWPMWIDQRTSPFRRNHR